MARHADQAAILLAHLHQAGSQTTAQGRAGHLSEGLREILARKLTTLAELDVLECLVAWRADSGADRHRLWRCHHFQGDHDYMAKLTGPTCADAACVSAPTSAGGDH